MKSKQYLTEIRGLSKDDLKLRAKQVAEELMKLRFRAAGGQQTQTHRIGALKRDLARIQTILAEKSVS